jgi:hypothetical protein
MRPWSRRLLYGVLGALWVSGAAWLYLQYLAPAGADFGAHPAQPLWMKLHGLAAMAFLIILGALLPSHVAPGWPKKRQRRSGVALLSLLGVLALSGWGLYYLSDEQGRHGLSLLHWGLGLAGPLFCLAHILKAKKK